MRYFGPRVLDTQGDTVSPPSMLFNTQFTAKLRRHVSITLDVFNILDSPAADVTSAINPALGGSGVNDFHFHPSQARTVKLTFSTAH